MLRCYRYKKFKEYIYWSFYVRLQWLFYRKSKIIGANKNFSIGITTYIARYENFFKRTIRQISTLFPGTEIIVLINGYHNLDIQKKYLVKITEELKQYKNVKTISHETPVGLSKIWNEIIIHSTNEKVFILNDDIVLSPGFPKYLLTSSILSHDICLINNTWSHFLISKKIIKKYGWFDERFKEIGNEDQDYEFTLLADNYKINNFGVAGIKSLSVFTEDFSFGPDVTLVNKKYTLSNLNFLNRKWNIYQEQKENAMYSEKFQIWVDRNPNFDKPNFYPQEKL